MSIIQNKTKDYFYISPNLKLTLIYALSIIILRNIMKQRKSSIFEVNMKVWRKDNRGLFDYSAPADQFKEETFNLRNNCTVYRDNVHG